MTRLRVTMIAAALAATAFAATQAAALTLRADVAATDDTVTVGDFFTDAGGHAETALFKAPAAGRSGHVSTDRLTSMIARHGLAWTPPLGLHQITVRRIRMEPVGPDAMRRLVDVIAGDLAASLAGIDTADDLSVTLNRDAAISAPAGLRDGDLRIARLDIEPAARRFTAEIVPGRGAAQVIRGRYTPTPRVPVLSRNVPRGTVITEAMVAWQRLQPGASTAPMLQIRSAIIGQAARRTLRAGVPVRPGDVEAPKIVRRNQLVTIAFAMPGMQLTTQGRALGDAALGDTIPVLNSRSKRVVQAVAHGEGQVQVGFRPARIAAR